MHESEESSLLYWYGHLLCRISVGVYFVHTGGS